MYFKCLCKFNIGDNLMWHLKKQWNTGLRIIKGGKIKNCKTFNETRQLQLLYVPTLDISNTPDSFLFFFDKFHRRKLLFGCVRKNVIELFNKNKKVYHSVIFIWITILGMKMRMRWERFETKQTEQSVNSTLKWSPALLILI